MTWPGPPPERHPPLGWILRLHPDGTTTATSPDDRRTLPSYGPRTSAA